MCPAPNYIARWNGTTWSGLLSGTFGINGNTVNTIAISGTDVLVGGFFSNAGGVTGADYIARWDGANNTWSGLLSGTFGISMARSPPSPSAARRCMSAASSSTRAA
jgi:hypothetical protein